MLDRLRETSARFRAWLRPSQLDRELDDELQAHVAMAIDDEIARGTPPDEARRRALARIGGVESARERHRDARGWPGIESLWRDLRDATRLLSRSPGFTITAVLSLALGIGGNTAIFSILNSLVLRPLPIHEPDRFVQLNSGAQRTSWTYPLWEQIRARADLFQGVAASSSSRLTPVALIDGDAFEPLDVLFVSGEYFDTLGLRPQLGRPLSLSDDVRGNQNDLAVVLSDGFWRTRFGADPDIVGRPLTLSRGTVTVVGVTPPGFFGLEVGRTFDMMMPIGAVSPTLLDIRTFWWVSIVARLKPGQTVESATSALQTQQPSLRAATLPTNLRPEDIDAYLSTPLSATSAATGFSSLRTLYQNPLTIIMAAVGLVLLIACANIANLLLARADSRRHELSVRLALGASRGRLVRQLLIESLLLASAGGAIGLLIASRGSRLLVQQLSTPTSLVDLPLPLDWRVLSFTAITAIVTAVLFGVAPALRATRLAPRTALVEKGRSVTGPSSARLAHGLVVTQIALSLVLAVGAGLLVRSFASLARFDLGFDPVPVIELNVRPHPTRPAAPGGMNIDAVIEAIRAAPGVEAAAFSDLNPPMSGSQQDNYLENPSGRSMSESERHVFFRNAGTDWFRTMGMRLVAGRGFTEADRLNAQQVAIVNESLARRFFPDANPIGETVREVGPPGTPSPALTIVGVVNDAIYNSVREGAPPTLYRFFPTASSLLVRGTDGDVDRLSRSVADAITRAEPNLLATTRPLFSRVQATVARERIVSMLSGFFAVLALLLAGVGVYGVLAYAVSRRRSEIAVRRALGATDASIAKLVLGRSLWLVACGTVIGVVGSYWLTGFLQPLLYDLTPGDPMTITISVLVLAGIGVLAGWLPTRRARRIDPAVVLRES